MKFTLEIELGNDAMQTYGDVRSALELLVKALRHCADLSPVLADGGGSIADGNGNKVGKWEVTA